MKNLAFIMISLFIIQQSPAQDKIIKLTGETIVCKVTEITNDIIKYNVLQEDLIRNIQKVKIERIIFENGKAENFSSRIQINGEEDWFKVSITNNEADVDGLVKGTEMKARAINSGLNSPNKRKLKMRTMEELKRNAAKSGYHTVLLLSQTSKGLHKAGRNGLSVTAVGIGYTYN
jgi:hypothetical protein